MQVGPFQTRVTTLRRWSSIVDRRLGELILAAFLLATGFLAARRTKRGAQDAQTAIVTKSNDNQSDKYAQCAMRHATIRDMEALGVPKSTRSSQSTL
jgi:hypothetical protein